MNNEDRFFRIAILILLISVCPAFVYVGYKAASNAKPCAHWFVNSEYMLVVVDPTKKEGPKMMPFQRCNKCGVIVTPNYIQNNDKK